MKRQLEVLVSFPDDVWMVLVEFYRPQCAVDWLRLIGTSKRMASLLHRPLLRWLRRMALPLTRPEAEIIADAWPNRRPGGVDFYERAYPGVWQSRCALVRYVGEASFSWTKRKKVEDFLTDLHILTDAERRYDAAGMVALLRPLYKAESGGGGVAVQLVLEDFRARFFWRL